MANGGTIEIDVELTGTKDIREGFSEIGNAGKALSETMGATNEKLGEGLAGVGESVFGIVDSFGELKAGIKNVGQVGSKGLLGLLGPIGMVATAGFALYETFMMISGAAQEAEENQSAMAAAAGDLQSKLEALAEKGVIPAAKEMKAFALMNSRVQFSKEKLQTAQEKLYKSYSKLHLATEELRKATANQNKVFKEQHDDIDAMSSATQRLAKAQKNLAKQNNAVSKAYDKLSVRQKEVMKGEKETEEIYKGLEERSAEFLLGKVKENAEKLKGLVLADLETKKSEDQFKLTSIQIEADTKRALIQAESNKENAKALLEQNQNLELAIKLVDEKRVANRREVFETQKAIDEINEKRKAASEKRSQEAQRMEAARMARLQKEKQTELKRITEGARIRQLQLEAEEDSTLKQIQLARHRFDTSKKLAGQNLNQQLIARLSFENEVTAINRQAEQQRLQEEKQIEEQRRSFALETLNFEIQQIEDQTQRELLMLQVKHDEELRLAQDNEEQKQELQRRFSIDFLKTLNSETDEMKLKFKEMFADMGKGFAEAAVASMLMGESFKNGIALVLQGLAKQAGVEALMETAKGIAALFINPAGASNHFAAAGAFGAAAVAAGAASSALGGGGGGGSFGGGGGGMSPSGSPQTSSMMQREEATSSSMVFNVNFSGAVVYDTKRAAEQALTDRVIKVMRSNRRGAPRV
jgi:hypothetical protein